VYDVANMRNNRIKELRALWEDSRFFYGKNRVMQLALGRTDAEEYRDGLSSVAEVCSLGIWGLSCYSEELPQDAGINYYACSILKA
jgi:hypothetical protein